MRIKNQRDFFRNLKINIYKGFAYFLNTFQFLIR